MARYYFDSRDNETFIPDEDGVESATLDEVKLTVFARNGRFREGRAAMFGRPYSDDRSS